MLIEVMGPASAGKSVLLGRARRLRSEQEPEWLGPREIDRAFGVVPAVHRYPALDDPETARFNHWVLRLIANSALRAAEKVTVGAAFARAEYLRQAVRGCALPAPVVLESLPLNIALTVLPFSPDLPTAAQKYFRTAPVPDAVVAVRASTDQLVQRIQGRNRPPAGYAGLSDIQVHEVATRANAAMHVALEVLTARSVPVLRVDTSASMAACASELDEWLRAQAPTEPSARTGELWQGLLATATSTTEAGGKHAEAQVPLPETGFRTRRFSVLPHQARQDSVERLKILGLTGPVVSGKSVLDVHSGTGAMLLQLSSLGIARGVAFDSDPEKVGLARAIASTSALGQLDFRQGKLAHLSADALGTFDVVLCLGAEIPDDDGDGLFGTLGALTRKRLCLEVPAGSDSQGVAEQLRAEGFESVEPAEIPDGGLGTPSGDPDLLIALK